MKLALILMASLAFGQECHTEPHGSGLMICTDKLEAAQYSGLGIAPIPTRQAMLAKLDAEIENRRAILKAAEAELRDALARRAKLLAEEK